MTEQKSSSITAGHVLIESFVYQREAGNIVRNDFVKTRVYPFKTSGAKRTISAVYSALKKKNDEISFTISVSVSDILNCAQSNRKFAHCLRKANICFLRDRVRRPIVSFLAGLEQMYGRDNNGFDTLPKRGIYVRTTETAVRVYKCADRFRFGYIISAE